MQSLGVTGLTIDGFSPPPSWGNQTPSTETKPSWAETEFQEDTSPENHHPSDRQLDNKKIGLASGSKRSYFKKSKDNPIWKYVHRKYEGSTIVVCNLCQQEVSLGSDPKTQTTGLAKRHLKRWHTEAFNLLEAETLRRKNGGSSAAIDPTFDETQPMDYHCEVEDPGKSWRRLTKDENEGFWSCFSRDREDPRYVECLICHQRISLSTGLSISSAKRHLFRKHVDQFNKIFPGAQPKYISVESDSKITSERRNSCEDWFEMIDETQSWDNDDDSVSVKSENFSATFLEIQEGEYDDGTDELVGRSGH